MKKKKEEKNENCLDDLWILLLFEFLLFGEPPKEKKVINIYMGDDK